MPIYKVRRVQTEVAHQLIAEDVYVEADSPEDAQERVEDGEADEVGSYDIGHTEYTGEIVSPPKAGSAEDTGAATFEELAEDDDVFIR